MLTTIHYIRHGQVDNPDNIAYGRMAGFHLSNIGEREAKKVGEFVKNKNISIIYTSPLERTFETANIISDAFEKKLRVVHKYELIEIDARKWQSFPIDELFQNKFFESFITDPESDEVPENLESLANRMEKFALFLCKQHGGQELICISHEISILALRLKLENKHLAQVKNENAKTASITTFVFNEDCSLKGTSYTELQ